jgi:ribonuclease BN (tRNA processing enzyme)
MGGMDVQFLGSGDAFGSGGRLNSCFHVTAAGGVFLIDCGASSLIAMRRFGVHPNSLHTVFVSHLHGDHFGGLPFLILDAQLYSRRSVPLTLVGPPGFRDRLVQAMELFFPGSSTVGRRFSTDVLEIDAGQTTTINGVTVTAFVVKHACGAPPFALRFSCEGKVLAYTGDTEWTESLIAVGRDADLLIAEALFFDRKVKYHLDYATLKGEPWPYRRWRVILTHMGPDMLAHVREVSEEIAEDGKTVTV